MHRTKLTWAALGVVLVVFIGSFARTANFGFVWDDRSEIVQNPLLRGPFLPGLFANQHQHEGFAYADWLRPVHDSYRPLRYVSYRLDGALFAQAPHAMHLHNVLLGLTCLAAAFWFLGTWGLGLGLRVVGVAVLALHPLVVEPVAYIAARSDLMAGGFMLVAMAAAMHSLSARTRGGAFLALACLALLCSLASKEAYVAVPLTLLPWAHARGVLRRAAGRVLVLGCVALGFWLLRARFAAAAGERNALEALLSLGPVFAQYARLFLLPFDCSIVRPAARGQLLPTLLLFSAYAALLVLGLRRPEGRAMRLLAAALWFATTLGPQVVATTITHVASDRYAYLALLAIPLGIDAAWPERALTPMLRTLALAAFALWGALCVIVSLVQVPTWLSSRTLYEHAVNMEPDAAGAWYGLGTSLAAEGGCEAAEPAFEKAIQLDPEHVRANNNVGVCRMRRGALREAETAFRRALARTGGVYPPAWANLARVQLARGARDEACASFSRALAMDPQNRATERERTAACTR